MRKECHVTADAIFNFSTLEGNMRRDNQRKQSGEEMNTDIIKE